MAYTKEQLTALADSAMAGADAKIKRAVKLIGQCMSTAEKRGLAPDQRLVDLRAQLTQLLSDMRDAHRQFFDETASFTEQQLANQRIQALTTRFEAIVNSLYAQ